MAQYRQLRPAQAAPIGSSFLNGMAMRVAFDQKNEEHQMAKDKDYRDRQDRTMDNMLGVLKENRAQDEAVRKAAQEERAIEQAKNVKRQQGITNSVTAANQRRAEAEHKKKMGEPQFKPEPAAGPTGPGTTQTRKSVDAAIANDDRFDKLSAEGAADLSSRVSSRTEAIQEATGFSFGKAMQIAIDREFGNVQTEEGRWWERDTTTYNPNGPAKEQGDPAFNPNDPFTLLPTE